MERSWRPLWAHMAPRSALEGSRPSFSTLRGPSGEHFPSIFEDVLRVFLAVFASPFRLRFGLRACLRALLFPSFKVTSI